MIDRWRRHLVVQGPAWPRKHSRPTRGVMLNCSPAARWWSRTTSMRRGKMPSCWSGGGAIAVVAEMESRGGGHGAAACAGGSVDAADPRRCWYQRPPVLQERRGTATWRRSPKSMRPDLRPGSGEPPTTTDAKAEAGRETPTWAASASPGR
ncbi:hypothetical protein ACPA9J_12105 [Pseudomonas aeruginosa]